MCKVTKYSTILGVFQQHWPGVSPTAILNEEKALGTRLLATGHDSKAILASHSPEPEEVGYGPKGILVAVINQSEHCIHSLVLSEKISPRNISWF